MSNEYVVTDVRREFGNSTLILMEIKVVSHGDEEWLLFGGRNGEYITEADTDIWAPIASDGNIEAMSVLFIACTRAAEVGHGLDLVNDLPNLDAPMAIHDKPWGVDISDEEALQMLRDALEVDGKCDEPRRKLIESHKSALGAGEADGVIGQSKRNNRPSYNFGYWFSGYPILKRRATEDYVVEMRRQVIQAREEYLNEQE